MSVAARWIRLSADGVPSLQAACAGFARVQGPDSAPAALWARCGDDRHAIAVVAPLKFVPGRSSRWCAWLLAPLVAAYRVRGVTAYFDADRICLSGQPISGVGASAVGACAVVVADFAAWGEAFLQALRLRVEAQYGWRFDTSWPSAAEREAIAGALAAGVAGAA
ncbi:MAG: hypothetical protein IT513_09535 [Burkholderiales bacterium]|nr:hypothetical protein [Burkholderiales bacterium]